MKKVVVFDGIKLCRVHAGMHRYMAECLRAMDPMLDDKPYRVEVVYPANFKITCPKLRNIRVKRILHVSLRDIQKYGKRAAVLTTQDQWWNEVLPAYIAKHHALFCGMVNDDPMGRVNVICLHDTLITNPKSQYSESLVKAYRRKYGLLRDHCRYLITVSNAAKQDISRELPYPEERIVVTYNGWEHMKRVGSDAGIQRLHPELRPKAFYYALGTVTPHKNYQWVVEAARRNPNSLFAVAGQLKQSSIVEEWKLPNLLYLGRVSDEENKWLMENCKAFIHPSILEGFGIPPLEALFCGAPIIVSTASCLPEIYEDVAHYIDPYRYDYDLDALLREPTGEPEKLLEKYSWSKSARIWIDMIERVLEEAREELET